MQANKYFDMRCRMLLYHTCKNVNEAVELGAEQIPNSFQTGKSQDFCEKMETFGKIIDGKTNWVMSQKWGMGY
jgi:hypothetical protein